MKNRIAEQRQLDLSASRARSEISHSGSNLERCNYHEEIIQNHNQMFKI